MANIQKWLPFLLKAEGNVIAKLKGDSGGLTYRGITIGTWKDMAPKFLNVPGTEATFRKMTMDQWKIIVKKGFWDALRLDEVKSDAVAMALADFGFHSGVYAPAPPVTIVQRILNQYHGKSLAEDGAIGPKTIAAINSVNDGVLFDQLHTARKAYLQKVIEKRPEMERFWDGFMNRLNALYSQKKSLCLPVELAPEPPCS